MANYSGPQESLAVVTLERYFLAADFLSGIGYGAQWVLYFICTRYLWTQRKARRMNIFMLAYITLLFSISTVVQVAQAHRTQLVFIENRNAPGGPWGYYKASRNGVMNIVAEGASIPLLLLSGVFMVWRCWVIWYSVNPYIAYAIAFFPSLMLLGSAIGSVFYFFALVHPTSIIAGVHTSAWEVTYYTLILGANVIVTVLILIRLIAHRHAVRKSLPPAQVREYTSLITMMIESLAPHSIIGAACLITTNVGSPVGILFSSASIPTQQLSGYLIIARLAYGHGWKTTTVSVHSKVVMRRHVSASDTQMSDEESGTISVD